MHLHINSRSSTAVIGQSIVEVIVVVGLVTLVLVGLITAITFSLSNAQFAKNKTLASKYGQESIEWFRNQRDTLGWTLFYTNATDAGRNYCLQTLSWTSSACTSGSEIAGTIFTRTAVLDGNGVSPGNNQDRVSIMVTVSWPQGSRTSQITLDTYLTKWQ